MKKLKIGVIGTGHMGSNHVRSLSQAEEFDLVGVYDVDAAQAGQLAGQYDVPAFSRLEELLSQAEAVVIAVPSSLHREIGLLVAEHGLHALIEKPLAMTSVDAGAIAEAFRAKGCKLAVGHIERFNPVIAALKKMLDSKSVFRIEAYRCSFFGNSGRITDSDVISDLMIHDIDLVCHLMEPCRITGIHKLSEKVRSDGADFATMFLDFDTGAHAILNASRVSQETERFLRIYLPDSCIHADLLSHSLEVLEHAETDIRGGCRQESILRKVSVPRGDQLRAEQMDFYRAVRENVPAGVDGAAAVRAIRICEDALDICGEVSQTW